jgi:hypothetical protein
VQQLQVQRDDELHRPAAATRRNLELVQTLRGEDSPTLFSLLDTCMTGMGSRMLEVLAAGAAARPRPGHRSGWTRSPACASMWTGRLPHRPR